MGSVEEQIRLDYALSGPLADLRSYLESFGIGGELDRLLKDWDDALATADFKTVAKGYRSLMKNILQAVAGHSASVNDALNVSSRHLALLLPAAVAGFDHQNALRADKECLNETLAELRGMLEAMEIYGSPQGYLRKRESSPWLEEHCNADELIGDDPILLYDFIFDVERFLSNLIYARDHFRQPCGVAC